jgi:hypothetical protein
MTYQNLKGLGSYKWQSKWVDLSKKLMDQCKKIKVLGFC